MSGDLLSLTPEAAQATLQEWLASRGEPAYRVRQIVPRLWQRPVAGWKDATDLPEELRAALDEAFPLRRLALKTHQQSSDGTQKYTIRSSGIFTPSPVLSIVRLKPTRPALLS